MKKIRLIVLLAGSLVVLVFLYQYGGNFIFAQLQQTTKGVGPQPILKFKISPPYKHLTAKVEELAKEVVAEFTAKINNADNYCGFSARPLWRPIKLNINVGDMGAGGATTFDIDRDRGQVFNFRMNVQGTLERIFDSVLPHEINHILFAMCFRRALPRCLDEGCASLAEPPFFLLGQAFPRAKNQCDRGGFLDNVNNFRQFFESMEYSENMIILVDHYSLSAAFNFYLIERGNEGGKNGNRILIEIIGGAGRTGARPLKPPIGALEEKMGDSFTNIYRDFYNWLCRGGNAKGKKLPTTAKEINDVLACRP